MKVKVFLFPDREKAEAEINAFFASNPNLVLKSINQQDSVFKVGDKYEFGMTVSIYYA